MRRGETFAGVIRIAAAASNPALRRWCWRAHAVAAIIYGTGKAGNARANSGRRRDAARQGGGGSAVGALGPLRADRHAARAVGCLPRCAVLAHLCLGDGDRRLRGRHWRAPAGATRADGVGRLRRRPRRRDRDAPRRIDAAPHRRLRGLRRDLRPDRERRSRRAHAVAVSLLLPGDRRALSRPSASSTWNSSPAPRRRRGSSRSVGTGCAGAGGPRPRRPGSGFGRSSGQATASAGSSRSRSPSRFP